MADVLLRRINRLIYASAPDGSPLTPAVKAWLADALTYYERKYDFSSEDGSAGFNLVERKIYQTHPRTGSIIFPIGLKSKMAVGLKAAGHNVLSAGGTLTASSPTAYVMDWDGLFADFKIYPSQAECLSRIVAADGGIIGATTGFGKSVMIRMLCRLYHKAKIHVVVKSRTLADEIYKDILTVIPGVGFVGDGKRKHGRVTIFVADSLHHGMGDADLVIADELHELLAPKYANKLGMYTQARIFGFSATPTGRSDNRDIIGEAICGPLLYTISYQEAVEMGRVVPITTEWIRVPTGPNVNHLTRPDLREKFGIWRNQTRNQLIAERVRQFDQDEQVLIMVKTIDHAAHLKYLLPDFTLAYAKDGMDKNRIDTYIDQGLLPADEPLMTGERSKQLREDFAAGKLKKVIANYVWSTGVNFRTLAVLVRADAAASEIRDGQIPGRVCRRVEGIKEAALLIDCWDEWDHRFLTRSRSRRRNYQKRGWMQVWGGSRAGRN